MKREQLFNAITDLRDDLIEGALKPLKKRHIRWVAPVAAVATIAITVTAILGSGRSLIPDPPVLDIPIESPEPAPSPKPDDLPEPEPDEPDKEPEPKPEPEPEPEPEPFVKLGVIAKAKAPRQYPEAANDASLRKSLVLFSKKTAPEVFKQREGENQIYSPLSLYISLGALSEIITQPARDEILGIFGLQNSSVLQERVQKLAGATFSTVAEGNFQISNSIWLDQALGYKEAPLKRLATLYSTSSSYGTMGSPEYEKLLQSWLKTATNGMIEPDPANPILTEGTQLAFFNAFQLTSLWASEFKEENNFTDTFHGAKEDQQVTYMTNRDLYDSFEGEHFTALSKPGSYGEMLFFLPEEGMSPEDLLTEKDFNDYLLGYGTEKYEMNLMNRRFVCPKFDLSSDLMLNENLKKLGIRAVFDPNTDSFEPILEKADGAFIQNFKQTIRVKVEEKGFAVAGYTYFNGWLGGAGEAPDFVLDRPFLFVIRYRGFPLFIGTVNQIS